LLGGQKRPRQVDALRARWMVLIDVHTSGDGRIAAVGCWAAKPETSEERAVLPRAANRISPPRPPSRAPLSAPEVRPYEPMVAGPGRRSALRMGRTAVVSAPCGRDDH
jgi:hypothetical protein